MNITPGQLLAKFEDTRMCGHPGGLELRESKPAGADEPKRKAPHYHSVQMYRVNVGQRSTL